ncbi:MAG: 1-deoxy-D-xylulose-5-phosphate reductoisomerase [Parcubacteria group bacterium]
MKNIVILGSTGSVGSQAVDVIRQFPRQLKIVGLAAKNSQRILEQIKAFRPKAVQIMEEDSAEELRKKLKQLGGAYKKIKILTGLSGLIELARLKEADIVLTSVSGSIGILPTYEAIKAKKTIALANKETLVAAGQVIMAAARKYGATIIPVDSEHSAIFQCLLGEKKESIERILLTCSGGPFRKTPQKEFKNITVATALRHPNWKMGGKITIDSSTLMNKGFEVIEARWLFDIDYKNIKVLVHPQSIVHSMVEFKDGAIKVQLGAATMKTPIQMALLYPERLKSKTATRMDLKKLNDLTFEEPDMVKFPCLKYAFEAGEIGGTMPCVLNAADEVAVEYFLAEKIKHIDIPQILRKAMKEHVLIKKPSLEDILKTDQEVKNKTRIYLDKKNGIKY